MKSQTLLPLIDFLLLTIMWLIRTRSESVLTVVVELLCSKKKRLTQSHIIAEKKNPQLKNKCSFPKWNHLFDPFPLVNFLLLHRLEQLPELVQLKHLLSPLTAEYQLILLANIMHSWRVGWHVNLYQSADYRLTYWQILVWYVGWHKSVDMSTTRWVACQSRISRNVDG